MAVDEGFGTIKPKIVAPPKPPITLAPQKINQFSPTSAYTGKPTGGIPGLLGSKFVSAANVKIGPYGGSLPGTFGNSNLTNITPQSGYQTTSAGTKFNPLAFKNTGALNITPESGYMRTPYGTYYNPGAQALPSSYDVSPASGHINTQYGTYYNPNAQGGWLTTPLTPGLPSTSLGGGFGGGGGGGGGYSYGSGGRGAFSMGLVNWRVG